jgi:hypothetical protein
MISSKKMLISFELTSFAGGGSVMALADALGRFNWENGPARLSLGALAKRDIKGKALA